MRYLAIFCVFLLVLVGCSDKEARNTLSRSDVAVKRVAEKLLAIKKGDILVLTDQNGKRLPDIDEVISLSSSTTVSVREISYRGIRQVECIKCIREENISFYTEYHRTRGAVMIIPAERVETFYLHIGSEAFMLSQ